MGILMDDIRHKLQTKPTRFLDQLRLHIRQQGLAYKTEQTYVYWVKRFIYFHNKQHPKNLGSVDVEAFLSHLAVNQFCSVNTQKIALNALVYLYKIRKGISRDIFLIISEETAGLFGAINSINKALNIDVEQS